jgi:putative two-component system response regulator
VLAKQLRSHPRFKNELNDEIIDLLYMSAPLHDLGKIAVPDHILHKAGKLTDAEFAEMKKHTNYGHDALRITEQKLGENSFLRYARQIAYTHQEKWDGSGYPHGLKGDAIPVSGRLMALADVYDALISKRVYKPPFSHEKAVKIIVEGKDTHFDADVVDAFVALEKTFRNIALSFADHEEERQMLSDGEEYKKGENRSFKNVLLVEDNEINLEIMLSQLTSMGYTVDTAVHGKDGLDKFQQKKFDVILTDIEMPEMDGYQMAEAIRRLENDSRHSTPILAITASEFDLNEEKAKSLGFSGYMLKPLEVDVLERKLADVIRRAPNSAKLEP